MPVHPVERKLAAIFAADIAGYSRLMARNEVGTLAQLKACRAIVDGLIASHRGRIFNTAGDSVVADFASAVDAVQCAVAVQAAIAAENARGTRDEPMQFRIGVHVGDVMVDGENLLGDGINIAARLEALAEPGAICISAAAHGQIGNKLPIGFVDLGDQQVKNIPQAIRVYRVQVEAPAPQPVASLPLPDKPSIAVLPFQNMSGDPEQEYFADGMVEEITTAIARLPWLFVIARNSAFTYKGKSVDVKQVARELGVRYVLEGSVRKGGSRVRITGQLIDTATGAHIWADRFDGALDDVFDLQDQVASSVAGAIEPTLRKAEMQRAARKPAESLDVYDLYLRALAELQAPGIEACDAALGLLRKALGIDPAYAPAIGLTAVLRSRQWVFGITLSQEELDEGVRMARRGIELGRDDPDVLSWSASALAWLRGDHAIALNAIERATALNPNSARAWHACGTVNCFAGYPEPAIAAIHTAMRLSPLDPAMGGFKSVLAYALMIAGRCEEAMDWADRALQDQPANHFTNRLKVALSGYLARPDAADWVARLLALNPANTIAGFKALGRALSARTMAVWVEGFRLAGLPEE